MAGAAVVEMGAAAVGAEARHRRQQQPLGEARAAAERPQRAEPLLEAAVALAAVHRLIVADRYGVLT